MKTLVAGISSGVLLGLLCSLLACGSPEGTMDDVRALQDAGAYSESLEPLRQILAERPDDPEANYRLGLALVRTGDASRAVFPLQKAARDESEARQAGLLLAITLVDIKNFAEAIDATDIVLARDPEDEAALSIRTQAALGASRPAVALDAAERLLALDPERASTLSLKAAALMHMGKLDETEEVLLATEKLDWEGDPSGRGRTCLVLANFYGRFREDPDRGVKKVKECLERFSDDLTLEPIAAQAYDDMGRPEEAKALMERAFARNPADQGLRRLLAQRLQAEGEGERAESMLLEGARTSGDPRAWISLAGSYRTRNEPEKALSAVDEALALAPRSEELRFVRADVLMDLGRLDEAQEIVPQVGNPVLAGVLRGRLALERGDPKQALAELGPAIQAWPQNAGARMLAAEAAHQLGDIDRTLSELREASRAEPRETDAALLLARLQLARGNYPEAAEMAHRHLSYRDAQSVSAYLVAARALAGLDRLDEAYEKLAELREKPGSAGVALAEEAGLRRGAEGPEAALAILRKETASIDLGAPENEIALRTLVDLAVAAGQAEQARERVAALAAAQPERARLAALQGQLALTAGDSAAAAAAFERALAADPACAPALAGQGELAAAAGRTDEALALLERAAEQEPDVPEHGHRAAQLQLAGGDAEGALRRLRVLRAQNPEHAGIANDLAFLLASRNESLDEALVLAQQSRRLAPQPEVIDTLGYVQLARGEYQAAAANFREALAARPDYGSARYHLGLALARQGDRDGAREAFQVALAGGPFDEAEQARQELGKLAGEGAGE